MSRSRSRLQDNAEIKFPVRLRIQIPGQGLGQQLDEMLHWLRARYGTGGFAFTGAPMPGMDAAFVYFPDITGAAEFAERFDFDLAAFPDRPLY
ncbi:MAG: hypothetical protein GYB53_19845 [Rhodobacteraceae bacterium]|nr:hypothetical protein [Paracoccaceae bacterium]MBR9823961.1 hypothetical protein [Paracoccaceae bacterium]